MELYIETNYRNSLRPRLRIIKFAGQRALVLCFSSLLLVVGASAAPRIQRVFTFGPAMRSESGTGVKGAGGGPRAYYQPVRVRK